MAMVASSTYRRSRPVSLHLARAVAARPELFGYVPEVLRLPSSVHLSLADVDHDHRILEIQHGLWGAGPVPVHADGRLLLQGDRIGGAVVESIEAPTAAEPDGIVGFEKGASHPASQVGISWRG